MAFGNFIIWDVRTTGSDSNGGGFNTANANFASDLTTDTNTGNTSSPVVSSASYNFAAGDVGHWLFVKGGTNWIPGWYQIASVASNKATLSAAIGAGYLLINGTSTAITTAAGVATVGTPTGGYWGIDYSQSNSASLSFTDMVIDGTTNTKFTSSGNPVGKNFIGNIINVTSGTGFTVQRVEVVSTSTITATCDKSLGTLSSTGGNGALGGALLSPALAAAVRGTGNDIFMKSGTYNLTTSTANVSGGKINDTAEGADQANPTYWVGWDTTRTVHNLDSNWPVINANAQSSLTLFNSTGTYKRTRNIIFDGNGQTAIVGAAISGNYQSSDHLRARNCTSYGLAFAGGNGFWADACSATGCSGSAGIYIASNAFSVLFNSESYGNSCIGIKLDANGIAINCISSGNTGGSSSGFSKGSVSAQFINCIAYNNGGNGFDTSVSVGRDSCVNCIAESNGGYGFSSGGVRGLVRLLNCAGYGNSSGNYVATDITDVVGFVSQTAGSFFTNAASGDFALNNIAGRGALLRGTGNPGVYPRGTTTGYADIGAAQHQDTGGGGGLACNPIGGFIG